MFIISLILAVMITSNALADSSIFNNHYVSAENRIVQKKDLNKKQLELVEQHEKQSKGITKYIKDHNLYIADGKYDEFCLDMVDVIMDESYKGCMLTTKLPVEVAPYSELLGYANYDLDTKIQEKEHNKNITYLKNKGCKEYMQAAKYHKQQTYCRMKHHSKSWYYKGMELYQKHIYKYAGIYIKKADVIWESKNPLFDDEVKYDAEYITHPIHLAGNLRNYAYDTDRQFQKAFWKELTKEEKEKLTKLYK